MSAQIIKASVSLVAVATSAVSLFVISWIGLALLGWVARGVDWPQFRLVFAILQWRWIMAGLALGSWAGGRLVRRLENRPAAFFLRLYGSADFTIGISGVVVVELLVLPVQPVLLVQLAQPVLLE